MVQFAWSLIKDNLLKVILLFCLCGTAGVLGVIPGTADLSNYLGTKIAAVKASLHTTGTPTVVQ